MEGEPLKDADSFHAGEELELTDGQLDELPVMEAERIIEEKEKRSEAYSFERFKYRLHRIFTIRDDAASHDAIRERILSNGRVTGTNVLILLCAILIASIGLNTDAVAVIIGAMLISPLMGTIQAMSYSALSGDSKNMKKAALGFLIQIGTALAVSTIYFLISPVKDPTPSIVARTAPNYFDVLIAFVGGTAGILAATRQSEYSNVLPGVAIATALMPPLCTCGWALANGRWMALLGAFYLFVINGYFIFLAGVIWLSAMAIPKVAELSLKQWRRRRIKMIRNTIIVLLPFIVLGILKILQLNHIIPFEWTNPLDPEARNSFMGLFFF